MARFIVSAVCLSFTLAPGSAQAPAELPPEVVTGWQSYAQRLNHAEVVSETQDEHVTVSKERRETKGSSSTKIAFNGANRRVEFSFHDSDFPTPERRVYACNSQYVFQLEGRPSGWVLVKHAPLGSAAAKEIEADLLRFYHVALLPVSVGVDPLAMLARNLRFKTGSQNVLELAAPLKSPNSPHDKTYQTLTVTLNDDPFRTVKSISGTHTIKNLVNPHTTFTTTLESKIVDGLPLLQSDVTEETYTYARGTGSTTARSTYQIDPSVARPESDFRLSAYGLPEPKDVAPIAARSRYRWFLIGAAVFAVIAVVFRYLARRRRKSETAGSNT